MLDKAVPTPLSCNDVKPLIQGPFFPEFLNPVCHEDGFPTIGVQPLEHGGTISQHERARDQNG